MTPTQYFDNEPSEEEPLNKDDIIKEVYKGFMTNLEIAANIVSTFPPEWQLSMLLSMMRDI